VRQQAASHLGPLLATISGLDPPSLAAPLSLAVPLSLAASQIQGGTRQHCVVTDIIVELDSRRRASPGPDAVNARG
jgi:hypothetical protein